jgi:hypothetical protein
VKLSDIVAVPIGWGSALRRRRVFHPVGVLAEGWIERLAPPAQGLPIASGEVVGRVSKGVGTAGRVPDIIGLAWKMPPTTSSADEWDLLLASTGSGLLSRFAIRPVTSWSGASLSSLMPYRFGEHHWWIRARLVTEIPGPGLSLDSIRNRIDDGGIQFAIDQACGTGPFELVAQLTLNRSLPDDASHDIAFDPTIRTPDDVQLEPGWLTDLRRRAYYRSRQNRDAR